ncbi:hypothetical protein HanRHA438_Chr02g0065051 [Helianthus annuus]|nr:hypothetical protein HanRHA438_Chr02g0065051 [Helianthus annuus]
MPQPLPTSSTTIATIVAALNHREDQLSPCVFRYHGIGCFDPRGRQTNHYVLAKDFRFRLRVGYFRRSRVWVLFRLFAGELLKEGEGYKI